APFDCTHLTHHHGSPPIHLFLFTHTPPTDTSTLSLHDALPISPGPPAHRPPMVARASTRGCQRCCGSGRASARSVGSPTAPPARSEEHTSELQSRGQLVCRLLLEKKSTTELSWN